ncbi:MAG TPA: histidine phosphatase family protein [Polyangiaceae bacterium]|nr:histidine phosphatase family protein [Polyangiaceae bacterium]
MTLLLLIRHGMTDAVGRRLSGRLPGVSLNAEGCAQAERLGARLASVPLHAIYCSPLERAQETARVIAASHALDARVRPSLTDIDFGAWSGKALSELHGEPEWTAFNTQRGSCRPPGGEHIAEVQARMVTELVQLGAQHPGQTIAVVGHADPLRVAIAFLCGAPLDSSQRLELAPGSLSVLRLQVGDAVLLRLNDTGADLPELR